MDDLAYQRRLVRLQRAPWKRVVDVQAPYRWNLRRLDPGYTLEVGCGIGRNLDNLKRIGARAVGIDQNRHCVSYAREHGYTTFTPEEFAASQFARSECFDSLLLSHVAEHLYFADLVTLLQGYVPSLSRAGRLILITPQELGFHSDPTHREFMDFEKLRAAAREVGFIPEREYSFPLPRSFGTIFRYNEFVSVSGRDPNFTAR